VGDNVLIDNEALTDFVNLKIKLTQSFECVYRVRVYIFIGASDRTCMSIYVCTVFLKNPEIKEGWCHGVRIGRAVGTPRASELSWWNQFKVCGNLS
jgi:hypothetical protein